MYMKGWPFEPLNAGTEPHGPPYDGGGGGTPH